MSECDWCFDEPCSCDDEIDSYVDDIPAPPLVGCACENAIIVDTTCAACIEWMREQDAEARTPPPPPPTEPGEPRG